MSSDRIQVAIASDAPYLPWAATSMLSALDRHEPGTLVFHLLHDGGISDDDDRRITELVTSSGGDIHLRTVRDDRMADLPPSPDGMVTWFRLLVPDLLADQDRVVVLDPDTFVAVPLEELWSTALGGRPVAAVANVVEPNKRRQVAAIGIDDPTAYFNAGVVLMDLARMREEGSVEAMLAFATTRAGRIPWLDQDALNVVFAGRWHALHPRWNAMNSLWLWPRWAREAFGADALREARTSPAILHFEGPGPLKPWHVLNDHPWRDAYRRVLARTPWDRPPLEADDHLVRLIGRLPRPWRMPAYWRWALLRRRRRSAGG